MRKYLKEMTELMGVSGHEEKVKEFIKEKIDGLYDDIYEDVMGNMIVLKKGKNSSKRIMVAAHMDEVGFLVTKIHKDGKLGISMVGGVDPRVVKSQRLLINNEIPAVVNSKPIHLEKETSSVAKYDSLKIECGFKKDEDAKEKVSLGDMVTFDVEYHENGDYALSKAFDDRAGCTVMMNVLESFKENNTKPEYDTYFAFVVQEETGLRGSGVAAEYIDPDAALILEGTTAGDNPENEPEKWATHLGDGPVLTFMHSGVVLERKIFENIVSTAKEMNIKYQYKMRTAGGTDAARLARTLGGIPAGVISVPCRYLHSPNTIINLKDYDSVYKITEKLLIDGRMIAE
ncbi:MAG: M42 family metallopeptidase [Thermotogota bacterium]